jgi:hypothetical protein
LKGGVEMKIKKLWLVVLTLAFMCMFTMVAFADDWTYSGDHLDAYGDSDKIYIKLPKDTGTDTNYTVTSNEIDTVITRGTNDKIIQDSTEIGIVILSDNYQNGLTSGMLPETLLAKYKDRITSMSIEGSGTIYIPKLVYDCQNLKSVTIEDTVTVTQINSSAFYGCTGLESIVIPEGVTTIGASAFSGCTGLKSIVISKGVETIGDDAFSNCESLESVVIPDGVTTIRYCQGSAKHFLYFFSRKFIFKFFNYSQTSKTSSKFHSISISLAEDI